MIGKWTIMKIVYQESDSKSDFKRLKKGVDRVDVINGWSLIESFAFLLPAVYEVAINV